MAPLSPLIRTLYLVVFGSLFFLMIPLVIWYAEGWRFSPELGVYKTGGVYLTVPYTNASITLEGREIGRTGVLQRNFFIDDLPPATYVLRVTREGYYPWDRMVVVEPQIVTEANTLLIPLTFTVTPLAFSGNATTTNVITRELYTDYLDAFATSTVAIPLNQEESVGLLIEGGNLAVSWLTAERPFASNFCFRPSQCETQFYVESGSDTVLRADFYAGGIVYRTQESGIYFTDYDIRPSSRVVPVYDKAGSDFRVIDGVLIIKDGSSLYEVGF